VQHTLRICYEGMVVSTGIKWKGNFGSFFSSSILCDLVPARYYFCSYGTTYLLLGCVGVYELLFFLEITVRTRAFKGDGGEKGIVRHLFSPPFINCMIAGLFNTEALDLPPYVGFIFCPGLFIFHLGGYIHVLSGAGASSLTHAFAE